VKRKNEYGYECSKTTSQEIRIRNYGYGSIIQVLGKGEKHVNIQGKIHFYFVLLFCTFVRVPKWESWAASPVIIYRSLLMIVIICFFCQTILLYSRILLLFWLDRFNKSLLHKTGLVMMKKRLHENAQKEKTKSKPKIVLMIMCLTTNLITSSQQIK
jgi:cell division protein FtsW (lipid II flippase)